MPKVRITVEETLKYTDEIIIEQPESVTNKQLEDVLSRIERRSNIQSVGDMVLELEGKGFRVIGHTNSFPDMPRDSEIEIIDLTDLKETNSDGSEADRTT